MEMVFYMVKNIKCGSILSSNEINFQIILITMISTNLSMFLYPKVHNIYGSQDVDVNSKHIEIILRLMTNWVMITRSEVHDILKTGRGLLPFNTKLL